MERVFLKEYLAGNTDGRKKQSPDFKNGTKGVTFILTYPRFMEWNPRFEDMGTVEITRPLKKFQKFLVSFNISDYL